MPRKGAQAFLGALAAAAEAFEFPLSGESHAKMLEHYELLLAWNRRLNLTSVVAPEEAAWRHFGESLAVAALPAEGETLADVGSGGGFPGLVVAAARPDVVVTCIESRQKKAVFLREASRHWPNVRVVADRLEMTESRWDWGAVRAVAAVEVLTALAERVQRVALLTGLSVGMKAIGTGDWEWEDPRPLQGGERRVLLIGRRKLNVPRETSPLDCST